MQQCIELTGTNRSIGLITLIYQCPSIWMVVNECGSDQKLIVVTSELLKVFAFCRPGGYCEGPAPDPISNSAVKTLSADGTAS